MRSIRQTLVLVAGAALFVTGCGGGGGGGGSSGEPPISTDPAVTGSAYSALTFTNLVMTGTTSEDATVTIAGQTDDDGVIDQQWAVTLPMDGVVLASDPGIGLSASTTITISVTDLAGNTEFPEREYDVDLNP